MRRRTPLTDAALRQIYADTIDPLYGYVSRRCGGDRQLAEDVTQETWLRAVRDWRAAGAPASPIAWLTTVARNLVLNHARRHVPLAHDDLTPGQVLAAVEASDVTESAAIATLVTRALARVPEREARLLELFHFERQRVAQIAGA
ncbi:MAG TPA: sigma-70 family RNA polymerase sigma factor, partial [Gemmatimonadaceae bacterium]|nr:sigma-70 family RNA polymerase sigma factor [Gemmatimonadaceae bacterium]